MEIVLDHLSKRYGNHDALREVSATLSDGVYGLLGANGAGKTTLINILVGTLRPDSGRIMIDGKDARLLGREFLSRIGYLPQYPQFYREFTVMDFLLYICALKGISEQEGKRRALELLETVNLSDCTKKRIGALSGGMRQRLGVVQAMLNDPAILILDEPTAGLDPQERIRFRNLIAQFSKDRLVLLATHIVSDVEYIANQVLLLKEGQLIAQAPPTVLEDGLRGQVWEATVSEQEAQPLFSRYEISSLRREGDALLLRILSPKQPVPNARPVQPSLEDVFLSQFGEVGQRASGVL